MLPTDPQPDWTEERDAHMDDPVESISSAHSFPVPPHYSSSPHSNQQITSPDYHETTSSVQCTLFEGSPSETFNYNYQESLASVPAPAPMYISQGIVERQLPGTLVSPAFRALENPRHPNTPTSPFHNRGHSWPSPLRTRMYEDSLPLQASGMVSADYYSTAMQNIPGEQNTHTLEAPMSMPETESFRYPESMLRTRSPSLFTSPYAFQRPRVASVGTNAAFPGSDSQYEDLYSSRATRIRATSCIPIGRHVSWPQIDASDDEIMRRSASLAAPVHEQSTRPPPGPTSEPSPPLALVPAVESSRPTYQHDRTAGVTGGRPSMLPGQSTVKKKRKSKMHQCEVCSKQFPRPSGLKTHMNTHNNYKPFSCSFPGCNRMFTVRSNAKRHRRTHGIDPEESMAESTGLRSGGDTDYVVNFSDPVVPSNEHGVTSVPPNLKWVPFSLSTRSNAGWLKPVSDDGNASSEEADDDPAIQQTTLTLTLPLQSVTPSGTTTDDMDEQHEERNSYAEAGQYPYHSSQVLSRPSYCSIMDSSLSEALMEVDHTNDFSSSCPGYTPRILEQKCLR